MPGEPVPVYIRRDFQITNAALGEELADESARTVVKVTHSPIPLNMMGDSDDEDYDDDMVVGSDEESDEDEEMEGEEDEEESEEGDEEEEGDSDDDSEDDSEDDFGEAEETVLCALTPGKIEQAQLNLTFIQGEVVVFQVSGPNAVHLMGNYIYQGGESDDEDDSDYSGSEFSDLDDEDEFDVEEFDEEIEVAPKG
jgi:FK506-binding nuclear protein